MKRPFDKSELTPEQRAEWDAAVEHEAKAFVAEWCDYEERRVREAQRVEAERKARTEAAGRAAARDRIAAQLRESMRKWS